MSQFDRVARRGMEAFVGRDGTGGILNALPELFPQGVVRGFEAPCFRTRASQRTPRRRKVDDRACRLVHDEPLGRRDFDRGLRTHGPSPGSILDKDCLL